MPKKKKAEPKKPRVYFFRNKEVVAHKKRLKSLEKERKELVNNLKEIAEAYNDGTIEIDDPADLFESLPIESMQELYAFTSGEPLDYNLFFLNLRQQLRKEHDESVESLQSIERKINESKLDVLLSKIRCIQENLDADIDK